MNEQSEYYLKPKKLFSQNFLTDQNIARKIAGSLPVNSNDLIIEIGCGGGSLTKFLLEKKCRLIGTEIDRDAIVILNKKFPQKDYPDFYLLNKDILKINLQDILTDYKLGDYKFLITGNIPYKISSEIFFWLYHQSKYINKVVLMVQKEVAHRLTASPRTKDYGILTIAMELTGSCKLLFDVPPTCFNPQPKVFSTVLEMEFNKSINMDEFSNVMEIVRTGFNQRRKTLRNSLNEYLNKKLNYDKEKISKLIFEYDEIYFKRRAEELKTEDFIKLKNLINNKK
ncbi:MAG: ribosomal RNA small subunit methyltransferase A [Ignavibacteriae bacterium]|nr:ribosomal RNA small subunit methyltransferase A [Ignavibacteriota bacterium]